MKKACMLGIVSFAAVQLAAEVIVTPADWKIGRDAKDPVVTEESFSATANGPDTILTLKSFQPFPAAENDLLTFSMCFPKGKKTTLQFFWMNDRDRKLSEAKSLRRTIVGTGELETCVIPLAGRTGWEGTITGLRLDPAALPKGTEAEFSIGEFKLTGLAGGLPIPAACWFRGSNYANHRIEGDTVTGDYTGKNDPQTLAKLPCPIPAERLKSVSFELSLPKGASSSGQLFWRPENQKAFNEKNAVRYRIPADDEFHEVRIDLSGNPNWSGNIVGLRLDTADKSAPAGQFRFRNFTVKQ